MNDNPPVTLQHVSGDVDDEGHGKAGYIDTIDLSPVEVMGQSRVTGAVIRIDADPARTKHFAIANFEETTFELISHNSSLSTTSLEIETVPID